MRITAEEELRRYHSCVRVGDGPNGPGHVVSMALWRNMREWRRAKREPKAAKS